jgi:hypothetical protein
LAPQKQELVKICTKGSNRKMDIEKLTRLKSKTWTNQQIKNHKKQP